MNNEEAKRFAFDSFVTAFTPGNELLLEEFFAADLTCINHSHNKTFDLASIKSKLPKLHQTYQDLKSIVKDVIADGSRLAFRVEQEAFYTPEQKQLKIDVMNVYTLAGGKVREWHIWENHPPKHT